MHADRQLALEPSQRLTHLVGVNWFFVSLARRAPRRGDLRAWLNEAESASHYRSRLWTSYAERSLANPDGIGTWAENGREITFLLEYDTGSENPPLPWAAARSRNVPEWARRDANLAADGRPRGPRLRRHGS